MAEFDLFVLNGKVVTVEEVGEFDIAVKDGKIARIVERGGLNGLGAKKSIDAQGGLVMVSHDHIIYSSELNSIARRSRCSRTLG